MLQQPAILVFNYEMTQRSVKNLQLQSLKTPSENSGESVGLLKAVLDVAQFKDKER